MPTQLQRVQVTGVSRCGAVEYAYLKVSRYAGLGRFILQETGPAALARLEVEEGWRAVSHSYEPNDYHHVFLLRREVPCGD